MGFNPKDYRLFDIVGKGSFGQVHRALDPNGRVVAIKVVDVDHSDPLETLDEINFLRKLHHQNILELYNVEIVGTTIWLCTEYCAGSSLHRILKSYGTPTEATACYILYSLLKAVDYIHANDIIHRDLKPANIFLDGSARVKLGDFGVSAQLTSTMPARNTMIGTPFWMAPEVISQSYYGAAADIWGIGVIAIEMATGETPWSKFKPTQAMMKIVDDDAPVLARSSCVRPGLLSTSYVSLVRQCVIKDPAKRCTANELVNQRWLTRFENPTREFRHLVCDQVARQPPLGRMHRNPLSVYDPNIQCTWNFDPTLQPQASLEQADALPARDNANSPEYLEYFDCALKAVENRSLKPECSIQTARVRLMLRKLDFDLSGLGKALLEEFKTAEKLKIKNDAWIDHVFYRLESRSTRANAKKNLRVVRASLLQLNRLFPGFGRALVEEVRGRIRHSPDLQNQVPV